MAPDADSVKVGLKTDQDPVTPPNLPVVMISLPNMIAPEIVVPLVQVYVPVPVNSRIFEDAAVAGWKGIAKRVKDAIRSAIVPIFR